ncbi:HTH domain-containing protein [Marinimicrobium sp. C2-29]|uniref:HTH domain-containing protein n=1 Tax=Marinimicrobium sp. C2-29 TaxID=3139825 RepID=UPI0031387D75
MLKTRKQSIVSGDESKNLIAGRDIHFYEGNIPTELVDQKIEEEVERLRKSRFFLEFDRARSAHRLGGRLEEGDLSGGSGDVKAWALAWCARILSRTDDLERAEELLELSKTLGDYPESKIAEAFVISEKKGKTAAIKALSGIDSDASCSARLMLVTHHDGSEGALSWMNDAGYVAGNLDSDGKGFLLNLQLELARWNEVAQTLNAISESDFKRSPFLYHLAALATLIPAIPKEYRSTVLSQVPFDAQRFPLASDTSSMEARRLSFKRFIDAIEVAQQLKSPRIAKTDDDYALWLQLRDPDMALEGKRRLESKLRDPDTRLGVVHYALQFGIKLDLDTVERDIDRSIAISGGMTIEAANARFALAFAKPSAKEAANYIARHQNQITEHIAPKLVQFRLIELFARAGSTGKAKAILSDLIEMGILSEEERTFQRLIAEAEGNNPVESRKMQYQETGSLDDLINLVDELENNKQWDDLCDYGKRLFEETRSLKDAERLVNALNIMQRSETVMAFLQEHSDWLLQSKHLRMSYAWALYHEGAFLESRAALEELSDEAGGPNYHALKVNLGIATGDWASLNAEISSEYDKKEEKSAQELVGAAQLALHLGSPLAKNLLFAAAAKGENDSSILAAAYFIATRAGWEDAPEVFQWLEKAAELSGEDGPLRRMSLKDILDQKPEWDRRESEMLRFLEQGRTPIFLAAQSLNRTLIDLTTFQALVNLSETDPRRKGAISSYSGKRLPIKLDFQGKAVALDATALLTLSFLNILDVALDAFKTVYIPHSTLGWLFEERQKVAFHQPSVIANAHKVRDLLATELLDKFSPSTATNSELSAQVGDELAALIADAEKRRDNDDSQHIVVRSAPVHRLSSLMEEEADLSAHTSVLSSCLSVVDKLRQKGHITAEEQKRAHAYLQLHEKPWPNQPPITDGATLYLDDLAITYLLHLGMLGKLKAAGFKALASPKAISETNALISYEQVSEEVKAIIERIRASLNSRIEAGKVRVSRRRNFNEFEENSIPDHPSVGILALTTQCDIAVLDDRFLNRHSNIESDGAQIPVFSTLDLLDALLAAGVLSEDNHLEHRTRLRRAGYFFVPLNADELEKCLRESPVDEGNVIENAELKAIREYVLCVRMSNWLQLTEEAPWLDGTLNAFVRVLKNLWVEGAEVEDITARSNWIVDQIDVRGWVHRLVPEAAENVVRVERAAHILLLLTPPTGAPRSIVNAYWKWLEVRVLRPLEEQFPEVYEWIVDWYKKELPRWLNTGFQGRPARD